MNTKRKHQVTFRLSEEEYRALKKKVTSSGYNQQEYLRRIALDKKIHNTEGIKSMLPEMKAQGTNLNQIAKRLNERNYVDYENILEPTLKEVKHTWQLLRQYLATLQ